MLFYFIYYPNVRNCYDRTEGQGDLWDCYSPSLKYWIRYYPIEYSWLLFGGWALVLWLGYRLGTTLIGLYWKRVSLIARQPKYDPVQTHDSFGN